MLSEMELPHWVMVIGAVFMLAGFIGWAFQKNEPNIPTQTTFPTPFRVPEGDEIGDDAGEETIPNELPGNFSENEGNER